MSGFLVLELDKKWNDFFYRISELLLATLIQRNDKKNHFIFDLVQERETHWNFTGPSGSNKASLAKRAR